MAVLTMKAAKTFHIVCLPPEEHISLKKIFGKPTFQKIKYSIIEIELSAININKYAELSLVVLSPSQ